MRASAAGSRAQAVALMLLASLAAAAVAVVGHVHDGCKTDQDCSMLGTCSYAVGRSLAGRCHCSQGWAGEHCEQLDLAPVQLGSGLDRLAPWDSAYEFLCLCVKSAATRHVHLNTCTKRLSCGCQSAYPRTHSQHAWVPTREIGNAPRSGVCVFCNVGETHNKRSLPRASRVPPSPPCTPSQAGLQPNVDLGRSSPAAAAAARRRGCWCWCWCRRERRGPALPHGVLGADAPLWHQLLAEQLRREARRLAGRGPARPLHAAAGRSLPAILARAHARARAGRGGCHVFHAQSQAHDAGRRAMQLLQRQLHQPVRLARLPRASTEYLGSTAKYSIRGYI